jgi:lactate dehydrogenase-like 2-hydroxyacid dehydrogenase
MAVVGRLIRNLARPSAISVPAPSAWSATATSPKGGENRRRDGRHGDTHQHPRQRTARLAATFGTVPASGRCPLAAGDIVSLHLPLTPDTDGLIDRAAMAEMKPGAVLVNTSRGPIVDEDALAGALRDGRLAAAGLDVFGVEPVPPDNPLLGLDNVVLTPHVTW